jgi:ketosteroid isomerase-like protein
MSANAEAELLRIEAEWARAFLANDADAIERFITEDWRIIGSYGNIADRERFIELLRSGKMTLSTMEREDQRVRVYDDTAIVTAQATSEGSFDGKPFSTQERATDVFIRRDGVWKCVHTQLTLIRPAS